MIMAQNTSESKITELLESMSQLFWFVQQAAEAGKPVHEVELGIWQRLLALGQQALEQFLIAQGTGDAGPTFTTPEGRELQRLQDLHPRCYHSIFGEFSLERAVYGTREGQKIEAVPLDARLQLPENSFSYVLQDWAQALGVDRRRGAGSAASSTKSSVRDRRPAANGKQTEIARRETAEDANALQLPGKKPVADAI